MLISSLESLHTFVRRNNRFEPFTTLPVTYSEGVSNPFKDEVEITVKETPSHIKKMLANSRETIVGANTVVGMFPNLSETRPRGWTKGTWKEAGGIYTNSKIVVAEKQLAPKSGEYVTNKNVRGILNHEIGHPLFSLLNIAALEDLDSAYKRDTSKFNNEEKEKLAYFLQSGEAGLDETFAESYAALRGGGGIEDVDFFLDSFFDFQKEVKAILDI